MEPNEKNPFDKKPRRPFFGSTAGVFILVVLISSPFLVQKDKQERAEAIAAQEARQKATREEVTKPGTLGNPTTVNNVLVFGEDRQILTGVPVCLTEVDAILLADTDNNEGYDAANALFKKLQIERRCFFIRNIGFTVGMLIKHGERVSVVEITNIVGRISKEKEVAGRRESVLIDVHIDAPAYLVSGFKWTPKKSDGPLI